MCFFCASPISFVFGSAPHVTHSDATAAALEAEAAACGKAEAASEAAVKELQSAITADEAAGKRPGLKLVVDDGAACMRG